MEVNLLVVISGNIVIPITEISSTAQFRITPQQFEILNEGVAKNSFVYDSYES